MTTIAAGSSAAAYAPVAASRPSDAAPPPARSASSGGDPFGPAVIVELSPAAKDVILRSNAQDEVIAFHSKAIADYMKSNGKSDEDIQTSLKTFEKNYKASQIRLEEGKRYENQIQISQPNLEQTLSDTGGPQSLINAVRDVTSLRYDVGASDAFVATFEKQETRDAIRTQFGDDVLQRLMSNGKIQDARARASVLNSGSALSRYGVDGPAFAVTDKGKFQLNSFTLRNVGGYALSFDAETSKFKVSKEGNDITALIFAGKAFG